MQFSAAQSRAAQLSFTPVKSWTSAIYPLIFNANSAGSCIVAIATDSTAAACLRLLGNFDMHLHTVELHCMQAVVVMAVLFNTTAAAACPLLHWTSECTFNFYTVIYRSQRHRDTTVQFEISPILWSDFQSEPLGPIKFLARHYARRHSYLTLAIRFVANIKMQRLFAFKHFFCQKISGNECLRMLVTVKDVPNPHHLRFLWRLILLDSPREFYCQLWKLFNANN